MKRTSLLFTLWIFQGVAALIWLAGMPTNTENGILFGFSFSRILLIGGAFCLTFISASLLVIQRRANYSIRPALVQPVKIISALIFIFAPIFILVLLSLGEGYAYYFSAYATRLTPLAAWFTLSSLELFFFCALENKASYKATPELKEFLLLTVFIIAILSLIAGFIIITKLGITRYNDGSWGNPTTPLLEWQIILALTASLIILSLKKTWHWLQNDKIICLVIYVSTCALWLSQPINPGFFATPPRAPNFEIYPFSDALIYAQYAQSALIGNGFMWPDVPTRPFYITFLTWLHAIAGQDYSKIIALQTLVLAFFPVLLYLLGKELSGRPLGFGLAILAALRDLTANFAAPFALNYTYSKLFFSEIPAAMLITLFTLIILRWMRQSKPFWIPLLAGGLLGLSALIRLQSAILLAAVIPLGFLIIKNGKKWFVASTLMILGVSLAMIPWLVRNYKASGGIILDNPISQTMVLARRWGGSNGNELIPRLPGEGDAQYSSRMAALALGSLRANPARIISSAVNHFFNNQIDSLLIFPLRDRLDNPRELLWPTRAFWQTWTGHPSGRQIPLLVLYSLFLAAGLAGAYQKNGVAGLLPLGLNLVYNGWTALFLSSGDRFLVPVDWAIYFYEFLGIFTISTLVFTGNTPNFTKIFSNPLDNETSIRNSWKKIGVVSTIIVFIGASIPLTEAVFPKKFASQFEQAANNNLGEVTLHGRAIYPRWYEANDGEPGTAKLGYGKSDQARLVFFLIGEKNTLVIFPINRAPEYFPNASNVAIQGTFAEGYMRAENVLILKDGKPAQKYP